jgi:hypothetical protein
VHIVVTCQKCGHARLLSRKEIVKGAWKRNPCPVYGYRDSTDEPAKPPAA